MPASSHTPRDALPGIAVSAGIGLLCGLALPLAWGGIPALVVSALALSVALWRGRAAPAPEALATLPAGHRWALAALLLAPLIPIVTLAARVIGALVVAFPAAVWALLPALLAALVLPRLRGSWSSGPVLAALVLGTLGAATWGARFEAAGAHARGETYGGPILGIHPFQSTAVAIDGFGPFDLPINDYVEPDGSKGYGPAALAEALQRDLRAIAERQFAAHGPARAHEAFAGALVEALDLPPARERLDRPAEAASQPRLHVVSGGVGRRSRVEFLCPGSLSDPRPRRADAVMERMCPEKYASEASAGLGLTGRWTGYTELRGQARASLGRALGWSSDQIEAEQRAIAWLALALALALAWGGQGRAAGGLARFGGAALVGAAVLGILLVMPGWKSQVAAMERAPAWQSPWLVAPWAALLALGAGHAELAGRAVHRWSRALPVAAASLGLAGSLAAAGFLTPELAPARAAPPALFGLVAAGRGASGLDADSALLPGERLIAGLGEALHRGAGIGLDVAEAIVAAVALVGLLGLLAALLVPTTRAAGIALTPARPAVGRRVGLLLVVVPAALLVLSRKTAGGAALLAPAAAMTWLAGAALALVGARSGRGARIVDLAASAAIAAIAGCQALADRENPMMLAAIAVLAAAAFGSLWLVRSPSGPPRPQTGA